MRKMIIFAGLMAILLVPMVAVAVEKAPRITDREIVERLTRLEEGQKAINKRFDDVNGRFDDVNMRINDLRAEMNGRFDDVNGRFDDLRAEMNDRFNTLQWMFGLFITISLVILGFVLRMQWQMQRRQTDMEATLNAHKDEFVFLKNLIEKLLPPRGVL
jgi:predicted nuclease with TOPRIM domain